MRSNVLFYVVMCVLSCIQMPIYSFYKLKGKGTAYTVSKCSGSLVFVLTAVGSLLFAKADAYSLMIIAQCCFLQLVIICFPERHLTD